MSRFFRYGSIWLLLLPLMLSGCIEKELDGVDVRTAATLQSQGALLLDVREPEEYAELRAPKSLSIPLGRIHTRMDELQPYRDKPICVIDRAGVRSARAVEKLQQAGFSQVSNVKGGLVDWEQAGLPLLRGAEVEQPEPVMDEEAFDLPVEEPAAELLSESAAQPAQPQ